MILIATINYFKSPGPDSQRDSVASAAAKWQQTRALTKGDVSLKLHCQPNSISLLWCSLPTMNTFRGKTPHSPWQKASNSERLFATSSSSEISSVLVVTAVYLKPSCHCVARLSGDHGSKLFLSDEGFINARHIPERIFPIA